MAVKASFVVHQAYDGLKGVVRGHYHREDTANITDCCYLGPARVSSAPAFQTVKVLCQGLGGRHHEQDVSAFC